MSDEADLAGRPAALTTYRAETLKMIRESGATSSSPAHYRGARFKAALWLYEHDHCTLTGRGFYIASAALDARRRGV